MEDIKIIFSAIWVACMLIFLLGDVMRIFAGDFVAGEMDGKKAGPGIWLLASIIMVIPIIMVILSVLLALPVNAWVNLIVAILFLLFNLAGIKGYKIYDQFLLLISFVFNILTIYLAINQI